MFAGSRRYLLVIALLLVGISLTWGQRWKSTAQVASQPQESAQASVQQTETFTYFIDVEGWYRITPYETVVRSPYDLTADSTETMAAALPSTLGEWQQVGPDQYIGDDPAVVYYLGQPTVALQRTYQDPSGQKVTLIIVGNKGEDSFLLFSHTPETCYPGQLWQVVENRRESAMLDDQPMHAQYLLTEHAQTGEQLMVLFWYLWDNPQRDSRDGVLSIRVNLFLAPGQTEEEALAQIWSFVRVLFPRTIPWERF
jgi:EpsI family protein